MDIRVRRAKTPELAWINSCYDTVNFQHSDFENEIIAIAEVDSVRAGLGRLVRIDSNVFELGGMLVFEQFRSLGLAKKIVAFLLEQNSEYEAIYCIPFEHLYGLYHSMGFNRCGELAAVPQKVREKYNWCQSYYPDNVLLLEKR